MNAEYSVEEVRARLGFVVSDREPRILTWESGGCHPASIAECALWDAYIECIKADEEVVAWRWRRHAKDAWHYDQFDSIEEMAAQEMRAKGWDVELLFAHLTQPAQSVDVEKVREVIAELRDYDEADATGLSEWADKLAAAVPHIDAPDSKR